MKKISLSIVAILFAAASVMADGGHVSAKKVKAKAKQATCTTTKCTKEQCAQTGCTDPKTCSHAGGCAGM